ncbi:MAG: glycosyltransferase family 2 protein [Pseudomonadota bacterium]
MNISLSIVVAAYNVQNYIEQCVQSILDQLAPDHELIVFNDGSTDATFERLRTLRQDWEGANFRIINQPNQGISGVRNGGIASARGEYLVFVDGDDVVRPGALAMLGEAIATHHPDAIAYDLRIWHPEDEQKSYRLSRGYPANELLSDQSTILNILFADRHMYACAYVYRRAIYLRLPTPVFPLGRVFEDISTTPCLHSLCETLLYLPHELINYRQHPTSITKAISAKSSHDLSTALSLAKQYLVERGVDASVKRHFDIAAAYFYVGAVKDSYQLSAVDGRRLRKQIKPIFAQTLFGDCASMLASTRSEGLVSHNLPRDVKTLKHVRLALNDNILFGIKQSVTRKLKLWRRQRKAAGVLQPMAVGTS